MQLTQQVMHPYDNHSNEQLNAYAVIVYCITTTYINRTKDEVVLLPELTELKSLHNQIKCEPN